MQKSSHLNCNFKKYLCDKLNNLIFNDYFWSKCLKRRNKGTIFYITAVTSCFVSAHL